MRTVLVTVNQQQNFTIPVAARSDEDAIAITEEIMKQNEQFEFLEARVLADEEINDEGKRTLH